MKHIPLSVKRYLYLLNGVLLLLLLEMANVHGMTKTIVPSTLHMTDE